MKLTEAEVLQEAIKVETMTDERLLRLPNYTVYQHAKEQIVFIKSIIQSGRLPNSEDKGRINIGFMAVKELEVSEPEYADALIDLGAHFKEL